MEAFTLEPTVEAFRPAGLSQHERVSDGKDEWLTPKEIIRSLGDFELDPCAPIKRPWEMAQRHFTTDTDDTDGLKQQWFGRVWLNPPYGTETEKWMQRMAEHGNGIALIFARTETSTWFRCVWPVADAIFFFRGRLAFCHVDGRRAQANAGAPSALVAYGQDNVAVIERSGLDGILIRLR
jgi:hypothetical protein